MRHARIISEVVRHPWAILDTKFDAIIEVLARAEAGDHLSEAEIRERVGERKVKAHPYFIDQEAAAMVSEAAMGDWKAAAGASSKGKLIAVLPVYGIIVDRVSSLDISETGTGLDALAKQFRSAMANPDVKAIVFDFNSPGGSVYGVDEFAQEIFNAREQKKIVAQISPLCASAAYYLASQCSEIAITPSGETGSIGVRSMWIGMQKALSMKGLEVKHFSAGKYKVEGNPHDPLSEDGAAYMQQRVNDYYEPFVKAVARGRDAKVSDVKNGFGEGRVVGATEAKRLGMVDRLATLDETLTRLGAAADSQRVSMSAPATPGVATTATAESDTEVQHMDTHNPAATAADQAREAGLLEVARCQKITQLAQMHNMLGKADGWITSKTSVETVQAEILASLKPQPVAQPAAEDARSGVEFVQDANDKVPAGEAFGRVLRAFAGAKGDRKNAAIIAKNTYRDDKVASMFMALDPQRASDFASGGFLLGDNLSTAVIELLRPKSVVRSLNPTLAPLIDGSLTLPKITGGATATYFGENKKIGVSKITGGQVKATAKGLGVIVPITNKLLRSPSANADVLVRNDAIRAIAQKEDLSFLRNAGTEWGPKGLLFWKGTGSFSANGTVNLVNVTADLQKAITTLEEANVDMSTCGWVIAPRTKGYLMQVRDGNGNYAFKDEMIKGTLMGFPFRSTSQVPKNLGGGSSSEIYFAAFSDVVIADAPQIAIEMSSEATLDDGTGTMIPLFQYDMSAVKVILEHDLIVRHQESVIVIDTVNWV